MTGPAQLPQVVRVRFAHAAVQDAATRAAARVLHVKGPVLDPILAAGRPVTGSDADVLVHPEDVTALVTTMLRDGWTAKSDFEHGSPFGHAANLWHEHWGYADVHRHFPGVGAPAARAFDLLWERRGSVTVADRGCAVPDLPAQALVLLLHAARGEGDRTGDVQIAWHRLAEPTRAAVRELATTLRAEVALAAAIGDLERHRDAPDYHLWRAYAGHAAPRDRWLARFRAADPRTRLAMAGRLFVIRRDVLSLTLARPATRADVAREYLARLRRLGGGR